MENKNKKKTEVKKENQTKDSTTENYTIKAVDTPYRPLSFLREGLYSGECLSIL